MSATTKFKVGDRVKVIGKEWGAFAGVTGVVTDVDNIGRPFITPDKDRPDGWGRDSFFWRGSDVELITLNEDDKIEAALAQTKEDLGLCEEFDEAVERARNMTFVERLDHVAISMNRGDVFAHFEDILHAPEYVMPELPKKGDYVRVTYVDGTTHESEVRSIQKPGSCDFYNIRFRESRWTVVPEDTEAYTKYFKTEPGNTIVKVEQIERPVEIPEAGDYVRLTMKNGETHEAEVTRSETWEHRQAIYWNGGSAWILLRSGDSAADFNTIVKVEQIERPVEIPEVGKWIEATTKDGETHTFEVTENKENPLCQGVTWVANRTSEAHFYVDAGTDNRGFTGKKSHIISWKYVAPPKEEVKPVEIDGYWVTRSPETGLVRAYLTEDAAKQDGVSQSQARTVEEAYESISRYSKAPPLRKYIPASLAIIKFLERSDNEED